MSDNRFSHIFLGRNSDPQPFTSHAGGSQEKELPKRHRRQHGEQLKNELKTAIEVARKERTESVGLDATDGIYLDFEIAAGFDSVLRSLENAKAGIELMNSRVEELTGKIFATVFVPEEGVGHFLSKVEEYLENDTRFGKPQNQKLVESVNGVRSAVLRSFWTDRIDLFPEKQTPIWWQVWLRSPSAPVIEKFVRGARRLEMLVGEQRPLVFPDRAVVLAYGTREQMSVSGEMLATIAELRMAPEPPSTFTNMAPPEQSEWVNDLVNRLQYPPGSAPSVCLLDTGINSGHPLLVKSLDASDLHAYNLNWNTDDHDGHGTRMAGLALYGDHLIPGMLSREKFYLWHRLESVKVVPRTGSNSPSLYGAITRDSVGRVEIQRPNQLRTICIGLPAIDHLALGRPTEWSAEVDKLAMGYPDEPRRLFVTHTGSVFNFSPVTYPGANETECVHDPGQAWNAITVGGYTNFDTVSEPDYDGIEVICPKGDLAPRSTTSLRWEEMWPYKPDVVMEAGNAVSDGEMIDFPESLSLLTTYENYLEKPFVGFGDSDGAAAQVARLAAMIQANYPSYWPETVRALIIHSARWTDAMNRRAARLPEASQRKRYKLRTFGYGVPDLERALYSAKNNLTLVMQNEIQPYEKDKTKEWDVIALPWPKDVLESLGATEVELKITLSYFIEPKPGSRGDRYRHVYSSHGLRFDIKLSTETLDMFKKRLNSSELEEDEKRPVAPGAGSAGWALGSNFRKKGSIHSDTWRGTAADLASREFIGVYPVMGWWRRSKLARWNNRVRYSLIVSLHTPSVDVDIYHRVQAQIETETNLDW